MVRNFCRFGRRRPRANGERVEGNRGIARPGNIENLPRPGGRVVGLSVATKEDHAVLTKRNEQPRQIPFFEKNRAGFEQRKIPKRVVHRAGILQPRHGESLGAVGLQKIDTVPIEGIRRVRVGRKVFARMTGH